MFQAKFYVIYCIIIFVLSAESRLPADAVVGGSTEITAEKKKEIEKLRTELRDALDEDENLQLRKGVIVQPKWLQGKDSTSGINSKVIVTKEGLEEVKALRAEIRKAVSEDIYVASVREDIGGNTETVKKLHEKFDLQRDEGTLVDTLVTASEGDFQHRPSYEDKLDILGISQDDQDEFFRAGPNIVESYSALELDIDLKKLQNLEISKRRTREVLTLKSIEEDFSFNFGEDVLAWAHIIHGGEEYFIGRRVTDLLVVRKNSTKYDHNFALPVGQPIFFLETYNFWNMAQQQQEGVILVALLDRILWYRVNEKSHLLELYWEWNIGFQIGALKHFKIDSKNFVAVGMKAPNIINIYQFKLKEKEFWIAQHLPMQHPFSEVSFLDTGRDLILALPQNHTAAIYTFNPNIPAFNHLHFQFLRSIPSEDIHHISAFKMGGQSYLALGGRNPQILLYQQGDFISKTILGQNFGVVELFFPIPVRTYRDDLLLLVQHRVEFSTHNLIVLETLIWDGDVFEISIPVPCKLGLHTEYGVNCMMDLNRDEGLKGAALLRRGDEISVIVPRQNAESGLFRLHTELLAKNSQLIDLKEIFNFLKNWVQEQDALIQEAQKFLNDAEEDSHFPSVENVDLELVESLKTPELIFRGEIDEIYLNDYRWTEQDTNTDLEFVIQAIQDLEIELRQIRHRRAIEAKELVYDSLDFDLVEVESLIVEKHNHRSFFIQDANMDVDGILNLHDLEVVEEVKGRVQREVTADSMDFIQNIQFDVINGLPWRTLNENLVWKNQQIKMTDLTIEGEAIFEKSLKVNGLNDIQFPEDYLWSSGPTTSIIKAEKVFRNNLAANFVDTDGLINGVNPIDAISLDFSQDWFGLPTFTFLEITEKFELNGTTKGQAVRNFPSNPILEDSEVIQAACFFDNLQIQGPLIVQNTFESDIFAHLQNNVIERNENSSEPLWIDGVKQFLDISFPIDLIVLSENLGNKSLHSFIPKHTSQNLTMQTMEGYVYFDNLTLLGLFDGVNISELVKHTVKIDVDQILPSTQLNFANILSAPDIQIVNNLNGIPVPEALQTTNEPIHLTKAHFYSINVSLINSPNHIGGNATLNGIVLKEFLRNDNWETDQSGAKGNIFLKDLILSQPLKTDELHGIAAQLVLDFLQDIDDLPDMILTGKVHIEKVLITGDVLIHHLNYQNFDEDIQMRAIWLNRPNFLNTNLVFKDIVKIQSNLTVLGELNGDNLVEMMTDIVYKDDNTTAVVFAPKNFLKDISVEGNVEALAINGLPTESLANTKNNLVINGSCEVKGNILVDSIRVENTINKYLMKQISNKIHFNPSNKEFVLLGSNIVRNKQNLNDLSILGDMNHLNNISEFFGNLVYKDQMCSLVGNNTFIGRVTIEKGAYIRNLNNYNLLTLLNNIVMRNEVKPIFIRSPVNFRRKIHLTDLSIKESLVTRVLRGCDLKEWIENTLRVDHSFNISKPLSFAPWTLDGNNIKTAYLNGVDLNEIVTLNSLQNLTKHFNFSDLYLDGEILVKGLTNQVDLDTEYENTLLESGIQHIETPLTLPSVKVLNNLEIMNPANGDKNLSDIAKLDERSIHFRTPLYFYKLVSRNLNTEYEISGIQLKEWLDRSLLLEYPSEQTIKGNWSIEKLIIKDEKPLQVGPFMSYETMARNPRSFKRSSEFCGKLLKQKKKTQKRKQYSIKNIEKGFILQLKSPLDNDFRKIFTLQTDKDNFILLNTWCYSSLYIWNVSAQNYKFLNSFDSGPLKDAFTLSNKSTIHLVKDFETSEHISCLERRTLDKRSPINIKFSDENTVPLGKGNERFSRSQLSLETKYSLPLFYKRSKFKIILQKSPSMKSWSNDYTFEDYRELLKNILSDLNYRLNLEINITQLSIPETDLYDEHLIQDFVNIIQEIHTQQFYASNLFSDLSLQSLDIPANPAQVLAARTVQIVWPIIVEIEDFHSHLEDPFHHNHQLCIQISNSLGLLINDVLNIMQVHQRKGSNTDNFDELIIVIERIRIFQKEMQQFADRLQKEFVKPSSYSIDENDESIEYSLNPERIDQSFSLQIGSDKSPFSLLVVPMNSNNKITGHIDVINLYLPHYNGSLFQSIKVKKPKFFTSIRANNESLLAFAEKRKTVRVLLYRGIQGFVDFSKFKISKNPEIISLFQVALPKTPTNSNELQHFLGIVLNQSIHFYQIVFAKQKISTGTSFTCL